MLRYKKVGVIVFLILAVLSLLIGLSSSFFTNPSNTISLKPTPTSVAQSQLSFSPASVTLTDTKQATVDVMLDTGGNNVTGVQLELRYDPEVISGMTISPGPFLTHGTNQPENLINKIDTKNGRATYALVLPLSQSAVNGKGVVATIAFEQKNLLPKSAMPTTTIQLIKTSLVTAEGIRKSVLKSITNATVTLYK